jgi:hypothetical protein
MVAPAFMLDKEALLPAMRLCLTECMQPFLHANAGSFIIDFAQGAPVSRRFA